MHDSRPNDYVRRACPICRRDLLEDFTDAAFVDNYPGLVCRKCDARAVNSKGASPEAGGMYFEEGDNPVFIDSLKCWRRYRFGGHVTMIGPYRLVYPDRAGCLNEEQYRELFGSLGIEARELRHVLRYQGLPRRVYFNRNRATGIYFSAHQDDEAWYSSNLWDKVYPHLVQKADQERLNVVPKPGMAAQAFRDLVVGWQSPGPPYPTDLPTPS